MGMDMGPNLGIPWAQPASGGVPPPPALPSGYIADWDASKLGLSNGAPVASFTDQTGNYTATQSTSGNQPTYATSVLNGLGVVSFNGTSDYFNVPTLIVTGSMAVFLLATKTSGQDCGFLGGVNGQCQIRYGETANSISSQDGPNSAQSSTLGVLTPNWSLLEYVSSGNTITFYQNGTSYGSGTFNGATFMLMGCLNTSSNFWSGYIAEAVVYPSSLSTVNRQAVEAYFLSKWGVG